MRVRQVGAVVAGLGAAMLLGPGSASAIIVEENITPGSDCRVVSGTASITSRGSITNADSAVELKLDCPMWVDLTSKPWMGPALAYVDDSSEVFACSFCKEESLGGGSVCGTFSSISNGAVEQWVTFASINAAFQGATHVRCTIPPASTGPARLNAYAVSISQ